MAILALLLTFPASSSLAQDTASALPKEVLRYVDSSTAVVGWVDISKFDIDALVKFVEELNGPSGSIEQMTQLKSTRDALTQLGVERVDWVSDLADLMNGPQAAIVPISAEKQDVVSVILRAIVGEKHNTVVIEKGVILAGGAAVIAKLQQSASGSPNEDLVTAVSRVRDPHGIVVLTPVSAMLPVLGILPQLVDGDAAKVSKAAEWLVNLRSVTLSGQLPPSSAMLRVSTKSEDVAKGLTEFVNAWASEKLSEAAKTVKLQAEAADIVLNITSIEQAIGVLGATRQLSTGNTGRNSMNSQKQIALAMHNFHDTYGHFPPQALADANGKRLLSWRVLILPFLDEGLLYKEFHLDEAWDSEHNIKLVAKMPDVLRFSGFPIEKSEPGKTRFVAPLTKNSVFGRSGGGVKIQDTIDGTSNTLMVVEVSPDKAVIWTKPEDVLINDDDPVSSIISSEFDGFTASLCDGSARFLSKTIDAATLKALLSISGRETIDHNKL